jgi:hypothetical protein
MYTASEKSAADRSASFVSRTVSLYSGANVAQVSTPHADQAISQSQTSASCHPPHARPWWVRLLCMLLLEKSPLTNPANMKIASGIMSSTPARYPNETPTRAPKTLKIHTHTTSPIPISCGRPTCAPPLEK